MSASLGKCRHCGNTFQFKRSDAVYCSSVCRCRAHRDKQRIKASLSDAVYGIKKLLERGENLEFLVPGMMELVASVKQLPAAETDNLEIKRLPAAETDSFRLSVSQIGETDKSEVEMRDKNGEVIELDDYVWHDGFAFTVNQFEEDTVLICDVHYQQTLVAKWVDPSELEVISEDEMEEHFS